MADEKQTLEIPRFIKVDSAFNNGSIEKATAELRLDTYKQIQNCFLGLCMFCGLIALAMQHSEMHKQQTLIRQTVDRLPEAEALYERSQVLIQKYDQEQDEHAAHGR